MQTTKSQKRKIDRAIREKDFKYLVKATLFHSKLSHRFSFSRQNYKMYAFYTPFAFWLWTEGRERSDEEFYKRFLREGDTVVDCGANIGLCTLLSAKIIGDKGFAVSFEPHPETYKQLRKNINLNKLKNVNAINKGLGNKQESLNFTSEYVSDINHVDKNGPIEIKITTLDEELVDMDKVTLLKLDVEGYELFTLIGGQNTLSKTKVLYFENNPKSFTRFGYSYTDVYDFLAKQKMSIYKEKDRLLKKLSREYTCLCNYENLIATTEENLDFLLKRLDITLEK